MKIVDLIKYEGDNTTLVWKHPSEDFNTLSQLVVHESQEALLFLNGVACDLFGPGRHTLHTQNIPLLRRIVNIPTGGESPFHCEVYFINKVEQMAINWGMGNVNFLDPQYNDYAFKIGASGEMSLKVSDSKKLITKLVGTEAVFNQETIKHYFKAPITTHIKTMLPNLLRERGVSIFEVEAALPELSEILKIRIAQEMADYGVTLEKFWISNVVKPEDDPYYINFNRQRGEKIALANQGQLDMQAADYQRRIELIGYSGTVEKRKMDVDAQRYAQDQLGYTYQQARGFDVMEKVAENEGSGSDLRNAAMGVGMGFGVGGAFGNALNSISNSTMLSNLTDPVSPAPLGSDAFVDMPGMISLKEDIPVNDTPTSHDPIADFQAKVQKLEMMRGILSEEEFAEKKNRLLREIGL